MSSPPSIKIGEHPPYRWLTSTEQYIGTLVRLCPEVLLGRHLAVTSIDSGVPELTDGQAAAHWTARSAVIYSPRLTTLENLFYQRDGPEVPGYDEWYLSDVGQPDLGQPFARDENPFEPADESRAGRLMVFVNTFVFAIHDPDPITQSVVDMFWRQLERISPESYIADGRDHLTFVSRNNVLFDAVHARLSAALSG